MYGKPMKLKKKSPHYWQEWNAATLSDTQIEELYALAQQRAEGVDDWPEGSAGRLAVAAQFLRLIQEDARREDIWRPHRDTPIARVNPMASQDIETRKDFLHKQLRTLIKERDDEQSF